MTKHTKGPYRVDPRCATRVIAGNDRTVCTTGGTADGTRATAEEGMANAVFFSATPDLYAVSKKVAVWLRRLAEQADKQAADTRFKSLVEASTKDAKNYRAVAMEIEAALAKAEGKG